MITEIKKLDNPIALTNIDIYGVCFHESQNTEYTRVFNKVKTITEKSYLFEYNVILNVQSINDYIGVFSWKFRSKTGMNKRVLFNILKNKKYNDYEIINLCNPLPMPYLEYSEKYHEGFNSLFSRVCEDLGFNVSEPKHVIYSNFFIAKKEIFYEFQKLLKKAINLLENKYKTEAWRDSNYQGMGVQKLKESTGLSYYTMHTFILERLMSVWIDNEKIKTLDVWK